MSGREQKLSILCLTKHYFVESLRSFGHSVITVGFNRENFELYPQDVTGYTQAGASHSLLGGFDLFFEHGAHIDEIFAALPEDFIPDVIVYFDDSNPVLYVCGLDEAAVPVLFYSIDAHIHAERHRILSGVFDRVLVAQADFVDAFREYCQDSVWFPLWSRVDVPAPPPDKRNGAAFRGGMDPQVNPKRVKFIEELARLVPLDAQTGPFCEAFQSAKIVVNQAIKRDLNFRVFEGMICGALVITPAIENGQRDLFKPGVHLVEYREDDASDAAEKVRYFLEHEEERRAIAEAGRALVLKNHTEEIRARQFEAQLFSLRTTIRPKRYSAALFQYIIQAKVEAWILKRPERAARMLERGTDCAVAAVLRREDSSSVFVANLLMQKLLLITLGVGSDALALARRVWQAQPENSALSLLYLGTLAQLGLKREAAAVARSFAEVPEKLVEESLKALNDIERPVIENLAAEKRRSLSYGLRETPLKR